MYEDVLQTIVNAIEDSGYEVEIDSDCIYVVSDDTHVGVKIKVDVMT